MLGAIVIPSEMRQNCISLIHFYRAIRFRARNTRFSFVCRFSIISGVGIVVCHSRGVTALLIVTANCTALQFPGSDTSGMVAPEIHSGTLTRNAGYRTRR